MIAKNIIKQPKSQIEITVTAPWSDVQGRWDATLQKLAADVELPGFRKGAAPLNLVEQHLGKRLEDEFLKEAMSALLAQVLQEAQIIPIDYPKYQLSSFVKGNSLSFRATITQRPQVSVGDYKAIKVTRPASKPVSDEEIDKMIDDLFKKWQKRATVTQPKTAISFNTPLVASPAQTQTNLPNDDFAIAMGATNLSDLKDKIKKDLEQHRSFDNELDFEEMILGEVEKLTQVDLPEVLVLDELNRMLLSLQRRVSDMGLLLEDYLKTQNKTVETLKGEWRGQAERNVKMELGLSEVARAENIQISDEELQSEIGKIQDAKLRAQFETEEPKLHLRHSLRQVKTLDLLKKLSSPV